MGRAKSNWEAKLVREMEEIASGLLHKGENFSMSNSLSEDTQKLVTESPHPDLMKIFIRLYNLLSPYDQWLLYCGVLSSVCAHNCSTVDAIKTCAYIVKYGAAFPEEPKRQPGIIAFMGAVFHYILTMWRVNVKGCCEWSRNLLGAYIPSGR